MARHAHPIESPLDRWRRCEPSCALAPGQAAALDAMAERAGPYAAALGATERAELTRSLHWDMISEYDARHLSTFLRTLDIPFSAEFRAAERVWARDEAVHFGGLGRLYVRWFGGDHAELATRRPDFAPLRHLFRDEFTIACLGAYDELVTARAYRAQFALYDRLGPEVGRFVRRVAADEGRHYGKFLGVLRRHHGHRRAEAPAVIDAIRAAEGTPYAATFVLDHDDDVFVEPMYDEARAVLLRHLGAGGA